MVYRLYMYKSKAVVGDSQIIERANGLIRSKLWGAGHSDHGMISFNTDRVMNQIENIFGGDAGSADQIQTADAFVFAGRVSERFKILSFEFAKINCRNETFWAFFSPLLQMIMGFGVTYLFYKLIG